ncbi:CD2 antigen cytoplasmic tail-binding protein 2 homolog [Drosophila guanche]|uniref:Blast:Replication factor C subunit 5 n=1 Tax=Drosophila guanche TaxID=7266 RepID=A0A3B0KDF5_DROGU|nr:CD2 antigen cytoplasmic tail-binding protein 2 homolog [Drosophila guanche]SPP81688.1 blast:Replication factor C subunit 5 [Drosophila guanche]
MAARRKRLHSDNERTSKKHTLDSDEEDSDHYEREYMNDSDIEGGEDGIPKVEDNVKVTPFNMREELEEGHFDKDGHYHWNNETEIKDNWLDNIDWVKIEKGDSKNDEQGLNSSDNSMAAPGNPFNLASTLRQMLEYLKEGESVQQALKRLGNQRPAVSTLEKIRQKKAGIVDPRAKDILKLTELANEVLLKTGNMNVYEETTKSIELKLTGLPGTSKAAVEGEVDMYADDFDVKESQRVKARTTSIQTVADSSEVMWEFKWTQNTDEIQGPFTTEKMLKWSKEKYFKSGVYARKCGEKSNFYSSNRIDFELYL